MTDPFSELDAPLPAIKVTCTSTDCESDLHCFLQKRKVDGAPVFGPCRECRTEPDFDIARLRRRDPDDIEYTFASLRHEKIRSHYWLKPFDEKALERARRKGLQGVMEAIGPRLRSSIRRKANGFDGRQTKLEGFVICYAQHATATCCRKCLSYWHDLPADRDLEPVELAYCETLVSAYLKKRLPPLDESD